MSKWKNTDVVFNNPDGSSTKFYIEETIGKNKKKRYDVIEEETPANLIHLEKEGE